MKIKTMCITLVILLFLSCKSFLINTALEKVGAYDERVVASKLIGINKEIVFIPMVHLSTELFYDDVKHKIDSLNKIGYYFYYEQTKGSLKEDTILRKIRKIRGIPFSKNGYNSLLDSLLNKRQRSKLKKEIVNQPDYKQLGLNEQNSVNVDATLRQIVDYYENTYGELVLESCDYGNTIYEKTDCDQKERDKQKYDEVAVAYRNNLVVEYLLNDNTHSKIAIVYGRNHIDGIKKELIERGYVDNKQVSN